MKINSENITHEPLLPETALEYFNDTLDISYKDYMRATSLRLCLENIVNSVFIYLTDENKIIKSKQWHDKTLNDKIKHVGSFFPKEILTKIHNIRKTGNDGPHEKNHKNLAIDKVTSALEDLSKICEWIIISYFKVMALIPSLGYPLYLVHFLQYIE